MRKLAWVWSWAFAMQLVAVAAFAQDPQTVSHVDLARYIGKWYEIARFPNKYESLCVANVTADYTMRADGNLDVVNRCEKANDEMEEAVGRARIVNSETNAKLQVRFAPSWLSWLPFVWADYWIIDLVPDYSVAAVGDPGRDYLWVLSRTPHLPDAVYEEVVNRITAQGYDTARLVKTKQD
jgi:apolipoprotein D and lipocalin family protein